MAFPAKTTLLEHYLIILNLHICNANATSFDLIKSSRWQSSYPVYFASSIFHVRCYIREALLTFGQQSSCAVLIPLFVDFNLVCFYVYILICARVGHGSVGSQNYSQLWWVGLDRVNDQNAHTCICSFVNNDNKQCLLILATSQEATINIRLVARGYHCHLHLAACPVSANCRGSVTITT